MLSCFLHKTPNGLRGLHLAGISQQMPGEKSEEMMRDCDNFWICLGYLMAGWWLGHPSEKYESIGMVRNPICGKIKNGIQTNQFWICLGYLMVSDCQTNLQHPRC